MLDDTRAAPVGLPPASGAETRGRLERLTRRLADSPRRHRRES